MKKQLLLVAAFLLTVSAAMAQKITSKELQGKWDLTLFDMGGVILDIKNDDIKFSDDIAAKLDEAGKQGVKDGMAEVMVAFEGSFLEFKGDKAIMATGGEEEIHHFKVIEKDGKQFISMTYSDGTEDGYEARLVKGNELHVIIEEDGKPLEFVYTKEGK